MSATYVEARKQRGGELLAARFTDRPFVEPPKTNRRLKRRAPLTPEQLALVASAERWLYQEIFRLPKWLVLLHGRDAIEQEARLAVCKAAHDFDPVKHPGVPFGAFARRGVYLHLLGIKYRSAERLSVWGTMPVATRHGEEDMPIDSTDHRRNSSEPTLTIWCDPDNVAQRKRLDMRSRVILFLRYVECWTLDEIGCAIGISWERVRQIEIAALARMKRMRERTGRDYT